MIVLIAGHRSMLAQELLPCLQQAGFTVAGRGRPELDITQAASIHTVFDEVQPDICINTAAYTAVDRAESEPAEAFAANRDGVAIWQLPATMLACPCCMFPPITSSMARRPARTGKRT